MFAILMPFALIDSHRFHFNSVSCDPVLLMRYEGCDIYNFDGREFSLFSMRVSYSIR